MVCGIWNRWPGGSWSLARGLWSWSLARGLWSWSLARGLWSWSLVVVSGRGLWSWSLGQWVHCEILNRWLVVSGRGLWSWSLVVVSGLLKSCLGSSDASVVHTLQLVGHAVLSLRSLGGNFLSTQLSLDNSSRVYLV